MTHPLDPAQDTYQYAIPAAFRSETSRRAVLKAAGLVALVGGGAATLASCSSPTAAPAGGTETSAAPSSSAPSASSASPSGSTVATADVPVGGGFIMPDADYVVTQPTKGSYKAFSKICTHQSCPVKQVVDQQIVCNCHGSHFSITDGSVLSGPARKSLPEAKATVSGDSIVVTA
jgi:Rieske Fe-S protein